jgi:oxygen-dependent protoporphyrinogen oxidase
MRRRARVAVIGGGIAGLAAAWELSGGAAGPADDTPEVTVLEAAPVVGGKLALTELAGRMVDAAPDGFITRRPEAEQLVRELGWGDRLRPVGANGASVWARGGPKPLPAGLVMGVPTRVRPVMRSGIVGWRGGMRLAVDAVVPRTDSRSPLGDRAVGPLIARKLGQRVVDQLVDPMLGGIHAGSVVDMSTAATFPLLLAVAQRRGSFMKALRQAAAEETKQQAADRGDDDPMPLFLTLEGGLGSLPAGLEAALRARGVAVRTSEAVGHLARGDGGTSWLLRTPDGESEVDGVVLATPAPATADLLAPHDPGAAKLLRDIDHASVAVLSFSFASSSVPADLHGTGLLVPRGTELPDTLAGEPAMVTACTYLSQKWTHLERAGEVVLRASVGRADDDRHFAFTDEELTRRVLHELGTLVGIEGAPIASSVSRWPRSLPQYRVHHLVRVAGVETAAQRLGALAVAGAALRGVGVPACIASGRTAARAVRTALAAP